jgi:hypothetical protein
MKFRSIRIFAALALILILSGCGGAAGSLSTSTPRPDTGTAVISSPAASSTPEATQTSSGKATASPGASLPPNWKEFTSKAFQVSLNYPADWTVKETQSSVELSSLQGVMVLLAPVETGGLSAEQYLNQDQLPNTRCTPGTNPHGLKVETCFDTIARNYSAYVVVKTGQGSPELLGLSLNRRSEIQTFETIIASLQPISS